jgi:hypothetical protein
LTVPSGAPIRVSNQVLESDEEGRKKIEEGRRIVDEAKEKYGYKYASP